MKVYCHTSYSSNKYCRYFKKGNWYEISNWHKVYSNSNKYVFIYTGILGVGTKEGLRFTKDETITNCDSYHDYFSDTKDIRKKKLNNIFKKI